MRSPREQAPKTIFGETVQVKIQIDTTHFNR